MSLSDGVVLAFYGDDFTGSTDAMEVTAHAGLRTVLFTGTPTADEVARFAEYRVVGIAGTARSRSPEWMDAHLSDAFAALASLGSPIVQYKVCSTFDSSPTVGSIGRAIDLGVPVVGGTWSPCIVGAPQLKRWVAFGNLFAAYDEGRYRIDRHPTMSRHPVTPMDEGDLTRHLARQTARPVVSIDLAEPDPDAAVARAAGAVAMIDVVDPRTQEVAGGLVWRHRGERLFSASSSGLQYALVAHWRASGALADAAPFARAPATGRVLVLSGSCSPMTARQIAAAEEAGFPAVRLDAIAAADPATAPAEVDRVLEAVAAGYRTAAGVIVYAARTVDDPAFAALAQYARDAGVPFGVAQERLGTALGAVAARAIAAHTPGRVVVAGGDSSGRVVACLPITALEVAYRFATGAPVCRCHSHNPAFDGLELVLKSGQFGTPGLFVDALTGL